MSVRALIFPRSLAIVGASPRHAETIESALECGIPVWGVNPNREEVLGLRCYPGAGDLPEAPETALLLVNHERIEAAFEDAAAAGVRAFVVPGLGAEAGPAGLPIAARLAARAKELGAAMLGPNCMGVAAPGGPAAWLGEVPEAVRPGHVAALCQSGSIADAFLSLDGRIGLRCVVSSGREAVNDAADFLDFFAADAETRAVAVFLETVRRPEAFCAALARLAEAGKPVVCLKVGRSEAAARAALSHTGALVGSDEAFSAVLRRYGAIRVDDFHELVETLELLGRRRWPRGTRLGAVSESGGECALLADQAEAAGIPFRPLPEDLAVRLTHAFPNYVTPGNPLDAWAVDDEEVVFPRSLELMAGSGAFDVLIAQIDLAEHRTESSRGWCATVIRALADVTRGTDTFGAVTSIHNADPPRKLQELATELDVPLLRGAGDSMRALAHVTRWRPARPLRPDPDPAPAVDDLLAGDGALPEHESALVLERCGVAFAPRRRADGPEQAARAAAELGFPVVVKLDGPAHKSRVGGVVLDVESAEAAAAAARELGGRVLVSKQVPAGPEAFCGMTRDPQYGPVLAVGAGGTAVETLGRVVLAVAPLDLEVARELVGEADLGDASGAVAAALVALSRLALAYPEIDSIDVNPLILHAGGAVAVDALVVVRRDGAVGV